MAAPRKNTKPSRDTGMLCGLCNKYGGVTKSHITSDCKRRTGAGKDHSEWRGRASSTKQLNAHAGGDDIKSLMAQWVKFNASIMQTVDKLSRKKKKKKSKRNRSYSSSDSSDSD